MRVVTVVGARPQFIKAAMVSRALRSKPGMEEIIVHTGQHYDDNMSDVFFRDLDMPKPDYNLGVGSASHGAQTGRMLEGIERVLLETKPDCVVVYGDTNSTLAGALAAVKMQLRAAHVEAGLRSYNRRMPEEINRIVADHVSDVLFAPTQTAVDNLISEGIPTDRVFLCGDVMYDAVLHYAEVFEARSSLLRDLGVERKGFILATVHRAENTDDPPRLAAIIGGLREATTLWPVVFPIHPRTRASMRDHGLTTEEGNGLIITEPVGYGDMLVLEKNARLIATDSGGVQKEAFFFRVPCVTLRDETEWVELVREGWNHLVPPLSAHAVHHGIAMSLETHGDETDPYGEGDAAERIVRVLGEGPQTDAQLG